MFAGIDANVIVRDVATPLGQSLLTLVPRDLGAPNVVTGILLAYRGFDTIGEVAVLFMVAAGVGLVLGESNQRRRKVDATLPPAQPATEIVENGARILLPMIAIFAAYIIMNGHLSAGGGFQGGAVIASGILLLLLALPKVGVDLAFLSATESIAGILFVLAGVAGLVFASGFFDSRILPLGTFGSLFSAGSIPILSLLLGIKVGCELGVIIVRFRG
nr:hydrogen gas-evolving membrane-bound hydrogenase subunit E [Hyphomicrobium methylovorum]